MKAVAYNVYLWRIDRKSVLALIESEIEEALSGSHSGSFVVALTGPMSGEEALRTKEDLNEK